MRFLAFILMLLAASPALAEHSHAIAMHGSPKYAADFKNLSYVNPAAPKGGELRLSKGGSFDTLNNHIITGNKVEGLKYCNDQLMQRVWDEPFTLYGLVAESVDVAADRSWIKFHLRKEARFHDGEPMTAEDVKFSYEHFRKDGPPIRRRVYGLITKVEITSPQDIKFTFGPGYDHESVMILGLMQVVPKHYWQKSDITKTTLKPPLCSGPYKITSVDPGRKIVYERVKDYWAKDLPVNVGQNNFDTISYTYFRDDDISIQAFKSGDYNLRNEYDVTKWQTRYDFKALDEGRVVKEEIAHQRPEWLKALIFNIRRPMFADIRVRKALSYLFNADWLNKSLYYGKMQKIASAFPNSELAASGKPKGEELRILEEYKADLPPEVFGEAWQPHNVNGRDARREAIALLKEAGWVYRDGKLVDKNGKQLSFEILLGDYADEKIALQFMRDLKKAGIDARVRTVDNAQFVGRQDAYDFDVIGWRWINTLSPGNEQVNYWGIKSAESKGARNYAGIMNKAVDALADSIGRSETRETLVARTHALDRALMQGYYMIPLFFLGKDLVAHTSDIHRPSVTPIYGMVLESWWHEPADKSP